jgi:diaminopropionate ammonia-lyase
MAGLRCAEPSSLAWPTIAAGVDAFVTVTDAQALATMALLAEGTGPEQIAAGPSGVCGLAALREIAGAPALTELRSLLPASGIRALVVITEGAAA